MSTGGGAVERREYFTILNTEGDLSRRRGEREDDPTQPPIKKKQFIVNYLKPKIKQCGVWVRDIINLEFEI